ncbi:hypothetical protein N0V83_005892 [Neocucurbitaria cava]|uniref:Zn(2)-C6 fungal-type domain-containing protein n=1 Tax=Neocucurbitaria cava TaxID=798079 RepID=A0A9W8Y5Y9_9PLEO|nr:hypothetical protein N0V83_005892 [Neocucurbitaria cava]
METSGQVEDQRRDSAVYHHDRQSFDEAHTNDDSMQDVVHTAETNNDSGSPDQHDGDQDMDHGNVEEDLPNDQEQKSAFDASSGGYQIGAPSPSSSSLQRTNSRSNQCSPDILEGEDRHETDPTTTRPRQSLFGGLIPEHEQQRFEGHFVGQDEDLEQLSGPGADAVHTMAREYREREKERSPSEEAPYNLGFGFDSSIRASASPRASPVPSEGSVIIPPDDQPVYELRQNIERNKAFTYIDTDKSGNFDPAEEAKQRMLRLHKAKAAKAAARQKKGKGKERGPKEHTMKCIVRLRFNAFGNVRNYTNDEDNWPEDWSEIDSDCEREMQEYRQYFRRNTPGREIQIVIEDPGDDVDDLTGYPAARGCKNCRKHEQECSMIKGGTYPCQECLDDECECEPIIAPTIKGRCKQCAEDGTACSFEEDPEQAICDHCADGEFICEALPPDGYKAERIDIYEISAGPDRQHTQCTMCRSEKKRCSLKKKTDKPPCKNCKKYGLGCTFFDLPKPAKKTKRGGGEVPTEGDAPEAIPGSDYFTAEDLADMQLMRDEKIVSREPTPELDMEDAEGHKGTLIKVQTSFAHPIQFNTLEQVSPDCNFCELPTFSFTGFYEKTVHVLKWNDGRGFSEIAAGHREDGNGATTMCQECVMSRLQIIYCDAHDLRQMYDANLDFDEAANDLMIAEPRSPDMRYQLQRWCSMCFSLATYRCCAQGETDEMDETDGCGLRLCSPCEMKLNTEFGGDVNAMVTAYDRMPKIGADTPDGTWAARADVGLLMKRGLLMANVEHDSQQAEE